MSDVLSLRPRFKCLSKAAPQTLADLVADHYALHTERLELQRREFHLVLSFRSHLLHIWSPQLTIEIEKEEESEQSLVRGLFAPNPAIWTFFMFMYGGFGTLGVFMAMFGFTQLTLGHTPWALWASIIFVVGLLATYLAAQYGKKRAEAQMEELRNFLRTAIGKHLLLRPVTNG